MISVLGGTGECGKSLLKELLKTAHFENVNLVARRSQLTSLPVENPIKSVKITENIVDFEKLCETTQNNENNPFTNSKAVFCCLGTTKANAGSAEKFIRIDKDYVIASAKHAKQAGVEEFHYVSASNSSAKSSFLYPRTKGEIEDELKALNFKRMAIYKPGLLFCDRTESRPGEAIARKIFGVFTIFGAENPLGSIKTDDIGRAMVANSKQGFEGYQCYSTADMMKLSKTLQ